MRAKPRHTLFDSDLPKTGAVLENILAESDHGGGDDYRLQTGAAFEGVIVDGRETFGQSGCGNARAALECPSKTDVDIVAAAKLDNTGRNVYRHQVRAVSESAVQDVD